MSHVQTGAGSRSRRSVVRRLGVRLGHLAVVHDDVRRHLDDRRRLRRRAPSGHEDARADAHEAVRL